MKKLFLILTMLFAASFSKANSALENKPDAVLSFAAGEYQAQLFWEIGPQQGAESVLLIHFLNAQTLQPTELPFDLSVKLFMPSMGHGSSPTKIEKVVDANGRELAGVYRVRKVYFMMAGDWEIRVAIKNTSYSETQSYFLNVEE